MNHAPSSRQFKKTKSLYTVPDFQARYLYIMLPFLDTHDTPSASYN